MSRYGPTVIWTPRSAVYHRWGPVAVRSVRRVIRGVEVDVEVVGCGATVGTPFAGGETGTEIWAQRLGLRRCRRCAW